MSSSSHRPQSKFAFDNEYTASSSQDKSRGLVSFFGDEEPTGGSGKTEWSAGRAPEEDRSEGFDHVEKSEEFESEEIKKLIREMPQNRK